MGQLPDSLPLDCKYIIINKSRDSIIIEYNITIEAWQQFEVTWGIDHHNLSYYIESLEKLLEKKEIAIQQLRQSIQSGITEMQELQLALEQITKQLNIQRKQEQNYQQETHQQERIYQILLAISALVMLLLIICIIRGCDCYEKSKITIENNNHDTNDK